MQQKSLKVVILGAGNVGTQLGKALKKVGIEIIEVWSRSTHSASTLAKELECSYRINLLEVSPHADIYLYTLKDEVIGNIAHALPFRNGLHLHTAGSLGLDVFPKELLHTGVFYPFQTFSKEKEVDFSNVPILIESRDKNDRATMHGLAKELSEQVYDADAETRLTVHVSGVFACNFTNHLYAIAKELLEERGLPFSIITPLIEETVTKLKSLTPKEAQTGPAIRGDISVMHKHEALLNNKKEWREIYHLISDDIQKMR